ncbi:mediator of RNA polymerase II transcription subunit 26 [Frankliniella occidentalis]|uniref:Mediator of RNA polymerase II transcription subunit 26 n=1 Tax=Frankliniella occidentalis TaxID=133901 RepID=A0A6J1SXF8_FRAOC|nr:mediator of RNA polymerase II transcription subunit 26 [Frankliniella occidentalis]
MQHSPTEIKEKLLKALDSHYNVVDMAAVVEVISILERTPITKDALETTRLGKFINELRRKTKNENLAKRAKDLVRRWRDMILPTSEPAPQTPQAPPGQQFNGATGHSTGLASAVANRVISSGHLSPGLPMRGNISPGLPSHGRHLNRSATVSPAMSLPSSDRSNTSPRPVSRSSTPRPGDPVTIPFKPSASAPAVDPVPKTHASNKRLRKEDSPIEEKPLKKVKRPNGLSTEPTSHGMANSLGRPDIIPSRDGSRGSYSPPSDHGSNSCEIVKTVPSDSIKKDSSEPKKRGRKKGSKNKSKGLDSVPDLSKDDIMKTKLSSVGRTHRVKTTQELLADLQARNTGLPSENVMPNVAENKASLPNCLLPGARAEDNDALEMSRNKTEHIAKFLRSQSDLELSNQEFPTSREMTEDSKERQFCREELDPSDEVSLPSRLSKDVKSPAGSNSREALSVERPISVQELRTENRQSPAHPVKGDKTVEEILLRLPPIDAESIEWDVSESPADSPPPKTVSEDDVCRLHGEHIDGVNGIVNHGRQDLKEGDIDFREWHETVSRTSYQGEMLHILPYVVID